MRPTKSQLDFCLTQLQRYIPPPPRAVVRVQKSKWGLKVGDHRLKDGITFIVTSTDSLGVTLEGTDGKVARIEEREALESYSKQPRPRRSRKTLPPLL